MGNLRDDDVRFIKAGTVSTPLVRTLRVTAVGNDVRDAQPGCCDVSQYSQASYPSYDDESRPAINNLLEIYHLITGTTPQAAEDHFAGKGYAQLKGDLAEATIEFLRPIQQRVKETTDERLDAILERGREKARQIASVTLNQVFERTGLK